MRILLFVFNIYNTIDNLNDDGIKEIIKLMNQVAEYDLDQKILVSICDDTDNREIALNFIRKFLDYGNITPGYIFLNDTYYKSIDDGAHIYEKSISKEEKVVNYANSLEEQDNYINLYYISGNEIDFYKFHGLNPNISCKVINESNENIINILNKPNYCMKYKRD